MCGLVGHFTFAPAQGAAAQRELVRSLARLGARRGPDGEGLWSDGAHCTLGFRRLAIVDRSSAAEQPMSTADGRHTLVCNGMLYNFRELRRELVAAGVCLRSSGDAEVVLNALAHWGTAALERFNGMFALAFYDRAERRLLLARDHAGMKPLFLLRSPHGVVFASQFDQILAHPWAHGRGLSRDGVGLYLRLGYIPAPFAAVDGASAVEAGTWIELDCGGERRGRFFELPQWHEPDLRGGEADEAVDEALAAAVKRHLVADVPIGAFLSGGVDSPLVAAMASRYGARPLPLFTIGTAGDVHDESADAARYAGALAATHHVEQLTAEDAAAMVEDVVSACAEPLADYSIFPTLAVARLARRHVGVALAGDGGDELFWGYAGRFGALLERLIAAGAPSERAWSLRRLLAVAADDPRWPRGIGDVLRIAHGHGAEPWLRRAVPDLPPWPRQLRLFEFADTDPDRAAQWLRWNEYSGYLGSLLAKVDRGGMYHSLEVRMPLLDREVIATALRVDWRTCLDPARRLGKLPLRRLLARHVAGVTRPKRGFTVAMPDWLRGPLRPLLERELLGRQSIAGLALDPAVVRDCIDRHLGGEDETFKLWNLLNLALWERRYRATA
jgi:asparagine synthase (glutamine-hydrolysing)